MDAEVLIWTLVFYGGVLAVIAALIGLATRGDSSGGDSTD